LRDALPLLARAEAVTGVIVGHPPEARGGEGTLAAWFDRHGCKGSVVRLPGDDADAGEPILRHAAQTPVDLIVMGFYGHSRLREFVLGGASRRMLAHSPTPLFLAH
jgi:nucleotide-binding universal stress UspA family protein